MELSDFLQAIINHCNFLEQEGFSLRKVDTSADRNFWFEKNTDSEAFSIAFGWTQYGDVFHISGLRALKRFDVIEEKIQKVVGGELGDYYTIYKLPPANLIPKKLKHEILENNVQFKLESENDISLFTHFLMEFYNDVAKVFYKDYSSPKDLYEELIPLLEAKKIQSLLTSSNNTAIIRFYTIALCLKNEFVLKFFEETYFPYLSKNLNSEINKVEKERLDGITKQIKHDT